MVEVYSNLVELQEKQATVLDPLEKRLEEALANSVDWIVEMFIHDRNRKSLQAFGQILYYFAEVSLRHIQIFLQLPEDKGTKTWDYRGYSIEMNAAAEAAEAALLAYEQGVLQLLTYNFEELIVYYEQTDVWLKSATEHPIYRQELFPFLALKLAAPFHKAYQGLSSKNKWKAQYLDFYADAAFLDGKIYQIEHGVWIKNDWS